MVSERYEVVSMESERYGVVGYGISVVWSCGVWDLSGMGLCATGSDRYGVAGYGAELWDMRARGAASCGRRPGMSIQPLVLGSGLIQGSPLTIWRGRRRVHQACPDDCLVAVLVVDLPPGCRLSGGVGFLHWAGCLVRN